MCEWDWDDLKQPLLETILSLYNGDYESEPSLLLDNLSGVFEILNFWRLHGKPGDEDGTEFTSKTLLNFFVDQVIQVINEILDKLLHKAIHRFGIVSLTKPTEDGALPQGSGEAPFHGEPLEEPHVFEYCQKPE